MILSASERDVVQTIQGLRADLLEYWPGTNRTAVKPLEAALKADRTLVTAADFLSDRIITEVLERHFPEIPIVSEEREASHLTTSETLWIVDPLDGTRAFASGSDDFAVMLSLRVAEIFRFSVVDFPAKGVMAIAKDDDFAISPAVEKSNITAHHGRPRLKSVYCDLTSLFIVQNQDINCECATSESTHILLEVARGTLEGAVVLVCGHQIWDVAALDHILRAAGCIFTDSEQRPLTYRAVPVLATYLVAARTPDLHSRLLTVVREHTRSS